MTKTPAFPTARPPSPEKHPVFDTHHGFTRTDDYAWLRADNWQVMFRDPSLLDGRIRAHLEAENAYQTVLMADTLAVRGDGPDFANTSDVLSVKVTETDAPPDYPLD